MPDSLLLWAFIFAVSLAVLVKASDVFTGAAEGLGLSLGVPPFVIGATVVAVGTSLPELVSSVVAVSDGAPEIVAGNVIGSNITNALLIMGLAGLLSRGVQIRHPTLSRDLAVLGLTAGLLFWACWDGEFGSLDRWVFGGALLLHLVFTLRQHSGPGPDDAADLPAAAGVGGYLLRILGAGVFVYIGAVYTVEGATRLAAGMGVGPEIVAVTVVAVGTSLPELVVTVRAAQQGKADIALGNVLGSNVFNILYVMTIPSLWAPLPVAPAIVGFSLPVMMLATGVLIGVCLDRRISRWEGGVMVALYAGFVVGVLVG